MSIDDFFESCQQWGQFSWLFLQLVVQFLDLFRFLTFCWIQISSTFTRHRLLQNVCSSCAPQPFIMSQMLPARRNSSIGWWQSAHRVIGPWCCSIYQSRRDCNAGSAFRMPHGLCLHGVRGSPHCVYDWTPWSDSERSWRHICLTGNALPMNSVDSARVSCSLLICLKSRFMTRWHFSFLLRLDWRNRYIVSIICSSQCFSYFTLSRVLSHV